MDWKTNGNNFSLSTCLVPLSTLPDQNELNTLRQLSLVNIFFLNEQPILSSVHNKQHEYEPN
jgi:hypothetical protein